MKYEQEPITNFRRDVVAEDELRLRVEDLARRLARVYRFRVAMAVRRLRGEPDIYLTAQDLLP